MPTNRIKTPPRKNKKNLNNDSNYGYLLFGIFFTFLIMFIFQYYFDKEIAKLISDLDSDKGWTELDFMDL